MAGNTRIPGTIIRSGSILVSAINNFAGNVTASLPTGTVSSSTQVNYTQLQNIPSGIVSSSTQVTSLLPTGTVSSSAQVTTLLPVGTVSSSAQVSTGSFTGSFTGQLTGTSSYATEALTSSYALNAGAGAGFPFSGSAVITGSLFMLSTGSVGGITGSLLGTASNATSASYALTASYIEEQLLTNLDTYTFTGNGSTTDFTITKLYNEDSLFVTVGGLSFVKTTDYTVSASTVSFLTAPASGAVVVVRGLMNVTQNATGSFAGTLYGTASWANNFPNVIIDKYTFVGDGATTNYTLTGTYLSQSLLVSVDGLSYTVDSDFTYTGYTLAFTTAPISESSITVRAVTTATLGTGSFAGTLEGTASYARAALTSSYITPTGLPSGTVSGSSQVVSYINGQTITPSVITASGHIVPSANETYDLGSPTLKWKDLYLSGSTIYLGTLQLKDQNGTLGVVNQSNQTLPISGSFTGSLFGTSSLAENVEYEDILNKPTLFSSSAQLPSGIASSSAQVTAYLPVGTVSSSVQVDFNTISSKPTLVSASSQITAAQTIGGDGLATTGSNTFTGVTSFSDTSNATSYLDGSVRLSGGMSIQKDLRISGSMVINGLLSVVSMSSQYVTSSQYNVGVSKITLNDDDNVRFAGMSIYDSGSSSPASASIYWDSLQHRFIYENLSGSAYNSAILLAGPQNTSTLGNEVGLTVGRVPVASGDDHIDSRLASSSIRVDFPSKLTHVEAGLYITGSVSSSVGFNGSGANITNIPNSGLVNSAVTVTAGSGLSGGGSVSLGGTTTVTLDTSSAHFTSGVKSKMNTDGVISSSAQQVVSTYTNATDNYVLTATGTGGITGEANLTFDGTNLTATRGLKAASAGVASSGFVDGLNLGSYDSIGYAASPGTALAIGGYRTSQWSGLEFYTAGTIKATLDSSGNVGINTTSPAARLDVSGSNSQALLLSKSPGATSALFVSGSGNVGVGTTVPGNKLHIWDGNIQLGGASDLAYYFRSISNSPNLLWAWRTTGGNMFLQFQQVDANVFTSPTTAIVVTNGNNVGIGTTNPNAKLSVNGNANVTGSFDVTGAFTAQTKSFKIPHQAQEGKSLVYGVLEGAEHAVYTRGIIKESNIITLPDEWEWLVDPKSITVQLTSIGLHQKLYVKNIEGRYITIENGGMFSGDIHCYYLIHATRKDVDPLITVV